MVNRGIPGILAAIIVLSCKEAEARTVRIGVYDNPPKVEMGPGSTPRGIFVDIIEHIAEREEWDIEYVHGTWDAGLRRLENDSIDLMPDVAFSEIRSQRFDFNQLAVISSWLQLFCRKDIVIESVADLQGKAVAVLEGSIQQRVCGEMRERLGLSFDLIALPDYQSTIRLVESGKADAIIASRFYGYRRGDALVPMPVILHPTALHFASPKGHNRDLLDAIDKHLAVMMNDPRSVYYRTLADWLGERPRMFIPLFVLWSIVSIGIILLFFFVLTLILRWQVGKRTRELDEKNRNLQAALQELKVARDEAIKRERLHAFGQLACGVAHDFGNLLVPIAGCADLMLRDPAELKNLENATMNLEMIKKAAAHGTEIVHRFQRFYRSAEHAEAKDRVDANAIIREVIQLARERWKGQAGAAIEVVLELGSRSGIMARKSDMHEMFLNLVLNAADAMPEGGRLEISSEDVDDAVCITVKDSGAGMTDEVRGNCLKPFYTTKGLKGTGMGLTMASNIVAEHGGGLTIKSAAGTGTSFIVTFSCAPSPAGSADDE